MGRLVLCPDCDSNDPAVIGIVGSPGPLHHGCMNDWHCTCTRGPDYDGPEVDCPLHGEGPAVRIALQTAADDVVVVDDDTDPYQDRYLAHQKRKAGQLEQILAERHSDRQFGGDITVEELQQITEAANLAPSSCDRHGVTMYPVESRDEKALLGGLLVGGVGWVHRAPTVFLLWADRRAYKAPGEVEYMPFLDAGVMVQNMWLTATSLGLAAAYVNPNVRADNQAFFRDRFIPEVGIFCGALAVGRPHPSTLPLLEREQGS